MIGRWQPELLMEIVIEPSDYRFLNAGDTAMMRIAMKRLCKMWPDACMHVFTDHPELLPHYSLRVSPLANSGRRLWLSKKIAKAYFFTRKSHDPNAPLIDQFLAQVRKADLFVVAGMG